MFQLCFINLPKKVVFSYLHSILTKLKSLYMSQAVSNFYGTEIEIWAGLLFGITEKNIWADYEQLLRAVFSCFQRQKKSQIFF